MRGGGVDLTGLFLEVCSAQVQGSQPLEQEPSNPVHGSCGKPKVRLVKPELHPAHEGVRHGLVVAPVLGPEHAAVAGDDAKLWAFSERGKDGLHVGGAAQQTLQQLTTPLRAGATQVVLCAPGALLSVNFHDELIRIEQPCVDQGNQRQDVASAVGNLQHPDVTQQGGALWLDAEFVARGVCDQEVELDRDALKVLQDLGQKLCVVDVHHGRNP